jgi:hypothetical protein
MTRTNHTSYQKPNPSRVTVPLKGYFERALYVPGRGLYPPPRCGVRHAAAWRPAAGSSPTPRTWTRPAGAV